MVSSAACSCDGFIFEVPKRACQSSGKDAAQETSYRLHRFCSKEERRGEERTFSQLLVALLVADVADLAADPPKLIYRVKLIVSPKENY